MCLWLTDSCNWEAVVAVEVFREEVEGEEEEGEREGRWGNGRPVLLRNAREMQLYHEHRNTCTYNSASS